MQEIAGKSLLNHFAYTCGVGIAAAKAGARHVVNVDFSEASLSIGKENARLNALPIRLRFVKSDVFAALRQLSGQGQAERVRGKRMPPFPRLEAHSFDVVFLDKIYDQRIAARYQPELFSRLNGTTTNT